VPGHPVRVQPPGRAPHKRHAAARDMNPRHAAGQRARDALHPPMTLINQARVLVDNAQRPEPRIAGVKVIGE